MSQTSIDFLNLFVRPPGELLYFLSAIALTLASLFMALGQRFRRSSDRSAQRYTLAALGVAVSWILLMAGALYTLLSHQDAVEILPPLESAGNVVTILLLGWAFLTADHSRWRGASNIVLLLLILATIVGYIATGTRWPSLAAQVDFNLSIFGIVWTFVPAVLALVGMLLTVLYFRIITDAPLKLVFFVVLLVGYGGTLYQISQGQLIGDYAGTARLALLIALPVLPAVVYRMVVSNLVAIHSQAVSPVKSQQANEPKKTAPLSPSSVGSGSPVERESVQLLRALGVMLEESTPTTVPERIVLAAIEVLKADIGVLFKLQDANYVDVLYAYDKPMSQVISGMALNLDNQPTLVNAIERQAQRPLYPDRNIEELQDFYTRLDVDQVGPVYFQPLIHSGVLTSILAVGLPYAKRELVDSEMELLRGVAVIASSLMSLSLAAQDASLMAEERAIQAMIQGITPDDLDDDQVLSAHQEMQASLELARDQIKQLSHQVMELKIELDDERSRMANALGDSEEGLSISQRIVVLTEEQQALRSERDRLAARLQDAEAMMVGATSSDNSAILEQLTESLQQEKEALQTERDSLQSQLDEIRATEGLPPEEVQSLIKRMSDERSRLEVERDHLQAKVGDIEAQLDALGIEGGVSGLMQLISQLFEQNTRLETSNAALKRERDTLRDSSGQMGVTTEQDKERETRILTLQTELLQLAADREAALKQRDKYRVDRDELVAKQEAVKQHRARLLAQVAGYEIELEESHQESTRLRTELQKLAEERIQLVSEQDHLRAAKQALETERDQLLARAGGDRERLQQLGEAGVGSLTRMIEDISKQRDALERELNETRVQMATVENQLEKWEVKSSGSDVAYQPQNPELLMGVVQELRTPITSISGYVDLLLGESAGILGEMQRKFLLRVSANVLRLTSMLDDLIHVTALDTGEFVLTPESIDVLALIEESITNASGQFREKGLTVHLNLDDGLPLIRADRDAIHQIVGQLLMNAYLVSPTNGEIFITARREQIKLPHNGQGEQLTDSLFVSVEDRGGGIAAEDEARVFARKYKADNPLIQGLGDTGVGLSIAKALVETHGGKLWLEAHENVGSSFCFALPLATSLETVDEG